MAKPKRPTNPLTLILGLSAVFFVLFLAITGVMFLSKPSGQKSAPVGAGLFGRGSVGIIELDGVIMDSRRFLRQLERFAEDDAIKAVVVRLNSPGGAVAPSQEIYEGVKSFKKPIVSSMGSVAASGAYYVAVGTRKIFANPGSIVGSIGVIMEFANLEKLYEWAKIRRFSIKTGRFKDAGAEYRPMEPEERELLQKMVDDVLLQFKEAVAEGRKLSMEQVTRVADGRILSGSQAKQAKLVDELGTLQEAINEAAKLGKIAGKPNVVYPDKPRRRLLELLLGTGSDEEEAQGRLAGAGGFLERLFGFSAPLQSVEERVTGLRPGIYWLWPGAR